MFVNVIKIIQFQMLHKLLGNLNVLEMKAIKSLVTNHNFIPV